MNAVRRSAMEENKNNFANIDLAIHQVLFEKINQHHIVYTNCLINIR